MNASQILLRAPKGGLQWAIFFLSPAFHSSDTDITPAWEMTGELKAQAKSEFRKGYFPIRMLSVFPRHLPPSLKRVDFIIPLCHSGSQRGPTPACRRIKKISDDNDSRKAGRLQRGRDFQMEVYRESRKGGVVILKGMPFKLFSSSFRNISVLSFFCVWTETYA